LVITNQYDAYLRRTNNGTVGIDAGYSYNIAGRLDQVANANSTVS
ncbi:MAG: hypothetical protein JWQ73_4357, partial [Variovorax sp.]|nr:hypothetical protein [Variovorax sp.]